MNGVFQQQQEPTGSAANSGGRRTRTLLELNEEGTVVDLRQAQ